MRNASSFINTSNRRRDHSLVGSLEPFLFFVIAFKSGNSFLVIA